MYWNNYEDGSGRVRATYLSFQIGLWALTVPLFIIRYYGNALASKLGLQLHLLFFIIFLHFNTIFRVFPFQLNIKSPFIDFNFFNAPRTRCCVQFEHGDVKRMLRTKFLFKFILYLTWLTILSRYPLFVFLVFLCWLRFLLCERVCVMPVSAISRNS